MATYEGVWWSPERPEEKCFGILRASGVQGLNLDLIQIDARHELTSSARLMRQWVESDTDNGKKILFGRSVDGKDFTLFRGFEVFSTIGMQSPAKVRIYFNRGIEGIHAAHPESIKVTHIGSRFPGMEAWIGKASIAISSVLDLKDLVVSTKEIEPEVYEIDQDRSLWILWRRNGPLRTPTQVKVSFEVLPHFQIQYSKAIPYMDAFEDMHIFGYLLSLLIGKITAPRSVVVWGIDSNDASDSANKPSIRPLFARNKLPNKVGELRESQVLLPLKALGANFGHLVKNWFSLYQTADHVLRAYFAGLLAPPAYVEDKFFRLAAAADGLHGIVHESSKLFPKEVKENVWNRISESIPADLRSHYKACLAHVNEYKYRDKVEELYNGVPSLTKDLIGTEGDLREFCKLTKDLRNVEAHRLPTDYALDGSTYEGLASKLRAIIDMSLLVKSGLSATEVENAMRQNREYWFYSANASWPWRGREKEKTS